MHRFIAGVDQQSLITSALARAELLRASHRQGSATLAKAREVLDSITAITINEALLDVAGAIKPPTLRTLNAIHLATAVELGTELRGFVAYDARLLAAARQAAMPTLTPR